MPHQERVPRSNMCDVRTYTFVNTRARALARFLSLRHDSGQPSAVAQADGSAAELGGSRH